MKKIFPLIFSLSLLFLSYGYAQDTIRIELKTDNWGTETTWELYNTSTNTLLASGGPYADRNSVIQNIPDVIVDGTGCYAFFIYDSYGDGICCSGGSGYYKVYYDDVLKAEGGQFTSRVVAHYGLGGACPKEIELAELTTPSYVEVNNPLTIGGIVRNQGIEALTSFDVRYKVDDGEWSEYYTRTGNASLGDTLAFNHDVPVLISNSELATITLTVEVSNPNEGADFYEGNNTLTSTINVYERTVRKKVLLEQMTTEQCGNCPQATAYLRGFVPSNENVIWVSHHVGYGEDRYTIAASQDMMPFYNSGGSYAPAVMINRERLILSAPGPIFETGYCTNELLNEQAEEPGLVEVNIDLAYDFSTDTLYATVSGEILTDLPYEQLRVTVYVLEDGLASTSQSGASGTYIHDNVVRAAMTSSKGDAYIISDNTSGTTFNKTYSTKLNPGWIKQNLRVVAIVHNWGTSVNNRIVLNSTQAVIQPSTEADILNFSFGSFEYTPTVIDSDRKTVDAVLKRSVSLLNLTPTFILSEGAIAKIGNEEQESGVTENNYSSALIYTIVAEDGETTEDWTINVRKYVSVDENMFSNVNIYPNPVSNMLNIDNAQGAKIQIINILGQEIISIDNISSNNQQINVSNLESGTYFVKLTNNNDILNYKIFINE